MMRGVGKVIVLGVIYATAVALLEHYFDIDIPASLGLLLGGVIGLYID